MVNPTNANKNFFIYQCPNLVSGATFCSESLLFFVFEPHFQTVRGPLSTIWKYDAAKVQKILSLQPFYFLSVSNELRDVPLRVVGHFLENYEEWRERYLLVDDHVLDFEQVVGF